MPRSRYPSILSRRLTAFLACFVLVACQQKSGTSKQPSPDVSDGSLLAAAHCSRCHLCPSPEDLPPEQWEFVLLWMGHYLGTETESEPDVIIPLFDDLVAKEPLLTHDEWSALREYFLKQAKPEPTPREVYGHLKPPSGIFQPGEKFTSTAAEQAITAFHFVPQTDKAHAQLLVANARKKEVAIYDVDGNYMSRRGPFPTETVDFFELDGQVGFVQIGHFFDAGNEGKLRLMGQPHESPILVQGLPRTAHARPLAPIGDKPARFILSSFGDNGPGDLRLVSTDGQSTEILFPQRGCVEARALDLDQDGDEDILALFTQGPQHMRALFNDGKGNYSDQKILWQSRPGQGYTGFELADLNQDGVLDLVTFAGNNLEIPDPPIRRYHGVTIYQGAPGVSFSARSFIPLPGAIAIEVADFNLDGRLDIAAVANFVDWRIEQPAGAILCIQQDAFQFRSERLPLASQAPYLSVKAADIDQDGDPDLLLGGFPMLPQVVPFEEELRAKAAVARQWSVTLLRNQAE